MKYLVSLAFGLCVCTSAFTQAPADFSAVDAKLKACGDRHPDIPGSSECALSAFNAADKQLNQVYAGIVAHFKKADADQAANNAEIVKRLVVSERAWVVFRDAQCSYMSTVALHAPLEGYEYQSCRYDLTKERIKVLTAPDAPSNAR